MGYALFSVGYRDIWKKVSLKVSNSGYQWERAKRLGVAERTIGYGLQR